MPMSLTEVFRYRKDKQVWQTALDKKAPKVGDRALDFELRDSSGANPIRLSDFQGQMPVALVFGSFT